jgi:hypothetical protein
LAAELIWKYYIIKDVESDKQHTIWQTQKYVL